MNCSTTSYLAACRKRGVHETRTASPNQQAAVSYALLQAKLALSSPATDCVHRTHCRNLRL